jgi:hypothetical protein
MFEKGNTIGKAGRPKGLKNRYNRDIRQVFHEVYDAMGDNIIDETTQKPLTGHDAMLNWARENPTEFYRLYGKMIPSTAEIKTDGHEDFIDELIFVDEQPALVEAKDITDEPKATDVGNDGHKQIESGEFTPLIEHDIPPPAKESHDLV